MRAYDGIVVGAGHNGLALAANLTRAGLKIVAFKQNTAVGGAPEPPNGT